MGCQLHFPKPAVSAVMVEDDRILLVKRGEEPGIGLWSIPGGKIELGETINEAMVREVLEETSLVVEAGSVAGVYDVIVKEDDIIQFHYVIIGIFAKVLAGEPVAGSDAVDAKWVKLKDIKNYPSTAGLAERLASFGLPV